MQPQIKYYEHGAARSEKRTEKYYLPGTQDLHREDGPASIDYYENGNKMYEGYYLNGLRSREEGPAFIKYRENGEMEYQVYYLNGKQHNATGPAYMEYDDNGNLIYAAYRYLGRQHREDGPSLINWDSQGRITRFSFFKNDMYLDLDAFAGVIDLKTGAILDKASFDLIYNVL